LVIFSDATFCYQIPRREVAFSLNGAKCIAKPNAAEQSFGQNMAGSSRLSLVTEGINLRFFGHLTAFASFGPALFTRAVAAPAILQ
jgi:hypothetical protein